MRYFYTWYNTAGRPFFNVENHDGKFEREIFSDREDASDGSVINSLTDWSKIS